MKISKYTVLLIGMVFAAVVSAFRLPAPASAPTGYDLAAAVNAYRAANGYYPLSPNSLVASAAQTHAEWIIATGQGGHIGASGSNETVRVSWTGYGGGASIQCDENWASGPSITEAMNGAWADWTHQEVMLNAWGNRYTDIGGGVASYGNGRYVFVLNVCKVIGQEFSGDVPPADSNPLATADLSNYIYGVIRATPAADGSITHTVQYGQTLATIAEAYEITINALRALNDMAPDHTIIWTDEELIIQPAGTVTQGAQASATPEIDLSPTPSTTAPLPTQTTQPSPAVTATAISETPQSVLENGQQTLTPGIIVIGLAGIGLVVSLYFSYRKK